MEMELSNGTWKVHVILKETKYLSSLLEVLFHQINMSTSGMADALAKQWVDSLFFIQRWQQIEKF